MVSRHFRLARASAVPTRPPLAGRSVSATRSTLAVTSLLALGVGIVAASDGAQAGQSGTAGQMSLQLVQSGQTIGQPDAAAREPVLGDRTRRIIQGALKHLGHYQAPIDGVFGRTTRAAIWRYQVGNGFNGTGYLTSDQILKLFLEAKGEGERLAAQAIADQQAAEQETAEAVDEDTAAQDMTPAEEVAERVEPDVADRIGAAATSDPADSGDATGSETGATDAVTTVETGKRSATPQGQAAKREPATASGMETAAAAQSAEPTDPSGSDTRASDTRAEADTLTVGERQADPVGRSVVTDEPSGVAATASSARSTDDNGRDGAPSRPTVATQEQAGEVTRAPRQPSPLEARAAEPEPAPEPAGIGRSRQVAALPTPVEPPPAEVAPAETATVPDRRGASGPQGAPSPQGSRGPQPVALPGPSQEDSGRTSDAAVTALAVPSLPLSALRRLDSGPEPVNARVRPSPPPAGGTVAPTTTTRPTAATARSGLQAVTPTDRAPVPVEATVSASRSLATARAGSDIPDGIGADAKRSTTVIASTRLGDLSFSTPRQVQDDSARQVAVAAVTPQAAEDTPVFPSASSGDGPAAELSPSSARDNGATAAPMESAPAPGTAIGPGLDVPETDQGPTGQDQSSQPAVTPTPGAGTAGPVSAGTGPGGLSDRVPPPGTGISSATGGSDNPGGLPGTPEAMRRDLPGGDTAPVGLPETDASAQEGSTTAPSTGTAGPVDLPPGIQASDIPQQTIQQAYVTPGPSDDRSDGTSGAAAPGLGGLVPGVAGRQDSDAPSAMPKVDQQVMQNRVLSAVPSGDDIEAAPTRDNWLERLSGTFTGYIQTPESPGEFPVSTRFDYVDGVLTGDFQSFINGRRQRGRLTEVKVLDRRTIEMTWRHLWEAGPVRFHFSEDLSSFNGQWGRDQVEGVAWVGARR